jgi:SAM-dependent methyltransferase
LLRNLTKENGGYQPINYLPHLTGRRRKKIYERMLITITDFCGDVKNKSFLDIGTCYGYFCFELTKLGALTIGVESNNERFNICKCLSKVYGCDPFNPKFINLDILDYEKLSDEKYDYVLLLNVFHYIIERNESVAWLLLNKLSEESEVVFITMSHERGLNLKSQRDIPESIFQNSVLTNVKNLGKGRGRGPRNIYAFWK